jgi:EAL domain-containing protein (putative c-di-GMP-specific phosphodiesterase class I)
VEDLLREADTALYNAKEQGRDRASLFNEALRDAVTTRLALESQLRPALERKEFEVWYQPEINLATGEVIAVEALLRWNHPSGEMYTADRFIDAAEEAGIIFDIGSWVMAEACRRSASWNSGHTGTPLIVRVNLSTRQLADWRLLSVIDDALQQSGLDPARLCVEITETALLIQSATSEENLKAIRARGIRIAVDDFGTGYASLAYLRDLVVDVIKIDRSFVSNIANNQHDRQLIAGILALAHELGISVTVEGVEDTQQAAILLDLGCVSAQGFLYSKAIPARDIPGFIGR